MSVPAWVPIAGAALARLAADALDGKLQTPGDVARSLVGVGLSLVPADELRGYLTEGAAMRGELAADIAEDVKFRPQIDPLDEDDS